MFDKLHEKREVKQLFDEIAAVYDLVYFGSGNMNESDNPLLGFTYDTNAKDDHFMHGVINDYETSIVHRTSELTHPEHESAEFSWTIVRVNAKSAELPHIFIDAHTYDELLYKHVFAKYPKLRAVTQSLTVNKSFVEHFSVFSTPEMNARISDYFDDTAMQYMLERMANIDIEINDNEVSVAYSGILQNLNDAKKLINNCFWVVEHIERKHELFQASD